MNVTVEVTAEVNFRVQIVDAASLDDAEDQALALVDEVYENLPGAIVDVYSEVFDVDSYEEED
jgi:hypothetical protein